MFRSVVPIVLCAALARGQDPSYYRAHDTWQKTAQASLEALRDGQPAPGGRGAMTLGSWLAVGPFIAATKDAFSEVFPPEREFAPAKTYGDGTLRWQAMPEWTDGTVVLFPPADNSVMYLSRTVTTAHGGMLALSLGSDDGISVWLDSALVFRHDVYRGAQAGQEAVDVTVPPGEHRLLLKINNGSGPTGFYFSLADYNIRTIWRLIARDFTTARQREEVRWETEDSIWAAPWPKGSHPELARRYAAATLFDTPGQRDAAIARAERERSSAGLARARARYLAARRAEINPVILTPKPPARPRINGPAILGVRPGNPFLHTIPATGSRPMRFSVRDLPIGLSVDRATGRISGTIRQRGTYPMTVSARNRSGSTQRTITVVAGDAIALTPPLGWNSWNCFATSVDDAKIRAAADAMVASGLINHGWTYINIDDCWEIKPGSQDPMLAGEPRGVDGRIKTNKKFPDMKALANYVHGKGLKLGIYSSPGPLTCAGFAGSYQFEPHDAAAYAEWGIDYLKYDWCSYGSIEKERTTAALRKPYSVMRQALDGVQRDIVYSLCQYGMGNVWDWGAAVGGNCWRTTGDIEDTWASMSGIGFSQAGHETAAKPGNWNDPDMLVVGMVGWGPALHPTRLTPNEQYTHITLWSLLASPLLIGCDMTQMDAYTLSLLTNDEVLEVNQDPLGKQAARIIVNGDLEVWAKDLADGSKAVGLFNRGRWTATVTAPFAALGLKGTFRVRDLWRQKDIGISGKEVSRPVQRHGAALFRLIPEKKR
jgi:alpha-galactosidase